MLEKVLLRARLLFKGEGRKGRIQCRTRCARFSFYIDALSHEPAMLRRWAWILHLFILNRGNGLELAYNRGSCILFSRISLGCKLVAVTYQEYECAVCLVIVSLCNRTTEGRIRQNSVVCNKRDRVIICVFCQDLYLTLMFSALVQKDLFKGM